MLTVGQRVRLHAPDRGILDAAAQVDAVYFPRPGHSSALAQMASLSCSSPAGGGAMTVALLDGQWWTLAHEPVEIRPLIADQPLA
jgi:hypothetical protein